jgi:Zn-dependent protease/CBS domain-containing protein
MDSSIRLGRIFGIPFGINYSWLIVFVLVIFLMSSNFQDMYPRWTAESRWAVAIITTLLFFLSVLLHELSHSLVALAWGIPVRGITLFIFGGVSQLGHEANRPLTEFLVSVVGPVTSLGLAGVLWLGWELVGGYSSHLSAVLFTLFAINLSLGVFNMLPGFPLDGGRVLRSAIWGATGNYWLATRVALHAGQGIGVLMMGGGIYWAMTGNFQAVWLALVGGFLLYVATVSYRQESVRQSLRSHRVEEALSGVWQPLPGHLPALSTEALMALFVTGYTGLLVDGPPFGVVTGRQLTHVNQQNLQSSTLAELMTPLSDFPTIDADTPVFDALEQIDESGDQVIALVKNGHAVGLLNRVEIEELIKASRRRG